MHHSTNPTGDRGVANKGGVDETEPFLQEPASLMDIGLLRGEIALSDFEFDGSVTAYIRYDWDNDNILIGQARRYDSTAFSEIDARVICDNWFRAIRQTLAVDPDTGEPVVPEFRPAAEWFGHNGFVRGKQSSDQYNFEAEVTVKIWLQYHTFFNSDGGRKSLTCKGILESKNYALEVR